VTAPDLARAPDPERVVILAGPSGSGKSRLAARLHAAHGWPIVRLDDFYRDGDDPTLPMTELGATRLVDWDDPGSWDAAAAVRAFTFARRLVRDLSERRKPPHILLRRGLALCRAEPEVIGRMERLGARRTSPARAESRLALVGPETGIPGQRPSRARG